LGRDQYEFPDDYYWDEFDRPGFGTWGATLAGNVDMERNFCNDGLMQSPIDLDVHNDGICTEFHEVRSIGGDCNVPGDNVKSLIESNKLRLEYRRRNCQDSSLPECRRVDPPRADFPGGWLNFADVLHVDFKIPSEHTMKGKRFDAEMQIVHLHPINKRLVVQSVLIEADEKGFNYYLQQALRAFHETFNSNLDRCRKRRRLSAGHDDEPDTTSNLWRDLARNLTITSSVDNTNRSLQQLDLPWDPHHPMLVPTIHYYRYDGSTTEPPCTEFVTWFVADAPMRISLDQLLMMKTMLFTNVDGRDCRPTSTHWEESVARPLQNVNGRTTHHCTPADFGPDP
jgi:carbonic anhydrase